MSKQWGTPTWYFFHTLAEHVDADFYKHNRTKFRQYITMICNCLPCPECSEHAKQYIKYNMIESKIMEKEDFKMFLLNFHNNVNMRKNQPQFTNINQYRSFKLIDKYNDFKRIYLRNSGLNRSFCDSLQRRNIIKTLEEFLKSNLTYFRWS